MSATQDNTNHPSEKAQQGDEVIDGVLGRIPSGLQRNIAVDIGKGRFGIKVILALLAGPSTGRRPAVVLVLFFNHGSLLVVNSSIRLDFVPAVPQRKLIFVVGDGVGVTGQIADEGIQILVVNTPLSTEEVLISDVRTGNTTRQKPSGVY